MRNRIVFFLMFFPVFGMAVSSQPLDKVVAVVNNNVITASELDTQIEQLRKQLIAKNVALPSEPILRKQVLQHLIDVEVQLQVAKNNGITVDSTELNDAVAKIATDNKLTLTQLREEVEKQGLAWDTYRENIRKEILVSRIQQKAVGADIAVTTQQVEDYLKIAKVNTEKQTFHIQNIVVPLVEEPTTEQVNKAQKKALVVLNKIKHGEDFGRLAVSESSDEYALEGGDLGERHLAELPELFASKVVNMKVGEVVGPIRAGNGFQLIKLVSIGENKEKHEVTKTHVRHILLKPDASMTEEEALKQINNLYQQLKSGKDFGLMAKQYSLDAASAIKGGDLGWVTAEELVPQFAEAMTGLAPHTISHPVHTPFGWHLIEVLERKTTDDSEAFKRQQVRQYLQQRKFSEAVQNWQQHTRADAYINVMDQELA